MTIARTVKTTTEKQIDAIKKEYQKLEKSIALVDSLHEKLKKNIKALEQEITQGIQATKQKKVTQIKKRVAKKT